MQVSFDPAKSEWNRLQRGFGFALQNFLARTLEYPARTVDGEERPKASVVVDPFEI